MIYGYFQSTWKEIHTLRVNFIKLNISLDNILELINYRIGLMAESGKLIINFGLEHKMKIGI